MPTGINSVSITELLPVCVQSQIVAACEGQDKYNLLFTCTAMFDEHLCQVENERVQEVGRIDTLRTRHKLRFLRTLIHIRMAGEAAEESGVFSLDVLRDELSHFSCVVPYRVGTSELTEEANAGLAFWSEQSSRAPSPVVMPV